MHVIISLDNNVYMEEKDQTIYDYIDKVGPINIFYNRLLYFR
jgi:hypothetical protein